MEDDVRVCRICLIMDVKMFDLQTFPLDTYFEPVVGISHINSMDLPSYICYECAALIRKYYNFRESCLLGQSVLYGILHTNGKITEELLRQINRQELNLTSNYSVHFQSEDTAIHYIYDETDRVIKDDPEMDIDHLIKMDCVKEEDDYNGFSEQPLTPSGPVSSDDEPLSLHKEKKVKKKERRNKKKREIKDFEVQLALDDNVEVTEASDLPTILTDMVQPKRKRGRPRKTESQVKLEGARPRVRRTHNTGGVEDEDVDIEDYVNVIKLTEEEQIEEIQNRQHSSNYRNAPFQCNLCFKGFIDPNTWKHHIGKHDPSAGDIECPICKVRFKTKRTFQKHASNHEKKFACKSCPYVSKTTTQAKQHQRWHKGVTYKCQYCDEVSTKWTSYLSHVRIKHPSDFICNICGYSFVSQLGLTMHRTMMHKDIVDKPETDENKGPFCAECDVKFVSVEAYKRHMVTSVKHTQSNDFNTGCRVCGETFSNPEELRVHHRKEHARKRPKNYGKKQSHMTWPAKCEHCPEQVESAREYWAHFRRAHPGASYPIQKDYVCDICGKSFRGNAFLVYHKRTHSTERAYKCAVCPKAFYNRTNLQMHEKTHSDSRPYPCNVCYKAFKCKGALDRHYRSHTGVKPYECEVCGKAFGQSNSRKLHVRTVHLKQPAPYVSRSRLERRRNPAPPREQQPFLY